MFHAQLISTFPNQSELQVKCTHTAQHIQHTQRNTPSVYDAAHPADFPKISRLNSSAVCDTQKTPYFSEATFLMESLDQYFRRQQARTKSETVSIFEILFHCSLLYAEINNEWRDWIFVLKLLSSSKRWIINPVNCILWVSVKFIVKSSPTGSTLVWVKNRRIELSSSP